MPYLGDSISGSAGPVYAAWAARVASQGGNPVTWPFADQYNGLSAASYPAQTYADLWNAGQLDANAPQQASGSNQYVYVLAGGDVQEDSPQTMTVWERVKNAALTAGDKAADTVGLGGSLAALEAAIKKYGTYLAIGAGVLLVLPIVAGAVVRRNPRGRRLSRTGARQRRRRRHARGRR